jgi:autotransporter-associated beta strand protein
MLAYNGGYDVDKTKTKDDETIRLSNNMTLSGAGDEQWTIQLEEDESQAASGATHSATDGLTAALISTVGRSVTFTLSGNIDGDGGVLHSGEGTLVLCGDSSYTGGTVITRGVVDVQSAFGLGATDEGMSAVKLGKDADLHVTVEPGPGGGRLVTTLATVGDETTVGDEILGDVSIAGSKYTERVLHMADNGYNAATTTLGEKGTFLLCGKPIDGQGISSHSGLLTGSGTVVVSDALGSGTTATFDTITNYTGDFRVEGHKSSIQVDNGSYSEGSIQVAGQQASVQIGGNVSIVSGESLYLRSMGKVPTQTESVDMGTGAVLVSKGEVSVAADAVLSVRRGETYYSYDLSGLSELEKAVSVTPTEIALPEESSASDYHKLGEDEDIPDYIPDYTGRFESRFAVNQQAVAGVKADVGLTLAGGCTYETYQGHLSLMGGSLKLDTLENNQLTFNTTLDYTWLNEDNVAQLVLFSNVSSVTFGLDQKVATEDTGVYYTRADRYLTGNEYIDSQTMLVYDSNVGVVYLQIKTPEPTTTTLGLVALAAMAARRRRKRD